MCFAPDCDCECETCTTARARGTNTVENGLREAFRHTREQGAAKLGEERAP